MRPDRLGHARRILAVRLDTIGDVVMTTPALAALATSGASVTLLTSSVSASLASMLPYVEDVVTIDVPWMKTAERRREPHRTHMAGLDELRRRAFDAAVVFTVSTQDPSCAAYLCYLSGIPRVAAHVRSKLYGLISDPVPDADDWPPQRHEVQRQIDLVSALGFRVDEPGLQISAPAPSRGVRAVVEQVQGRAWCVVHPGATAPSRRYPLDGWAEVIDRLEARGVRVVLAGGKQDRDRCTEIVRLTQTEPVPVYARLALPELTALLKAAPAAVTCNSSAAHLAAAMGTPLVTLYAGTNPQHTPWDTQSVVLRTDTACTWCLSSTCRHAAPVCISSIPPRAVAEAVIEQLAAAARFDGVVAERSTSAHRR